MSIQMQCLHAVNTRVAHMNTPHKVRIFPELVLWAGRSNSIPPPQHYICLLQKVQIKFHPLWKVTVGIGRPWTASNAWHQLWQMKAFIQDSHHRKKNYSFKKKKKNNWTACSSVNTLWKQEGEHQVYWVVRDWYTVFLSALCLCEHFSSETEKTLQYKTGQREEWNTRSHVSYSYNTRPFLFL